MKTLLFVLTLLIVIPTSAQEYIKEFSAQNQFDTQYEQVVSKYAYENYKGSHK